RNFQESLQKALRGLETDRDGFNEILDLKAENTAEVLRRELSLPGSDRLWYVGDAFRYGMGFDEVQQLTHIDPWFLIQIQELVEIENQLKERSLNDIDEAEMRALKRKGFADSRLAKLLHKTEKQFRSHRHALGVRPVYKRVDTCAAEFSTSTAYMYSTYDEECEANPT
ncbi:MAG TPA: carbamoyl phosphate synthase large subunit, partial [Methylophaga sp.]|nr:carbamoyl phosphate synthase large subunit [Methylophaga sp.]